MRLLSRFGDQSTLDPAPTTARVLAAGRHLLLTTLRRSDTRVPTRVWTVPISDDRIGLGTADGMRTIRRLRHKPPGTIQALAVTDAHRRSHPIPGPDEMRQS